MKRNRADAFEFVSTDAGQAGAISAIHRDVFVRSWSEAEVRGLLGGVSTGGITALRDRQPVGFLIFRMFPKEAEILSIAVSPNERRRGAARAMMIRLEQHLSQHGCGALFLEVDASNLAALALYGSLAFEQVGVRRRYYKYDDGRRGDAIVMRKRLKLDLVAQTGEYGRQNDQASSSA